MIEKNGELALSFVDTHVLTILFNCMSQTEVHNMFIRRQNKNKHGSLTIPALNWKQTKYLSTMH